MAAHSKGERRGYNLRWDDRTQSIAKRRARELGLTMLEYLLYLIAQDEAATYGESSVPTRNQVQCETLPGLENSKHVAAA